MMRAPDTAAAFDALRLYGTFDAAQWQKIKADLAAAGIDLEATKLPAMAEKPEWLPADSTLRDAVQYIAAYYGALMRLQKPPTPLQQAGELQATVNTLATALAVTDRTDLADGLAREIADLKNRVAELKAKGNASADNPKKRRDDYWRVQARVWLALKPNVSRRYRRAHLRRYLIDCSAPLLDEAGIESKIAAFVAHLFASKRRPK